MPRRSTAQLSLDECVTEYIAWVRYEGKSAETIKGYVKRLSLFTRWFEREKGTPAMLSDFHEQTVIAYTESLRSRGRWSTPGAVVPADGKPLSPHSIQDQIRVLKGFATWLFEQERTQRNVLARMPLPQAPRVPAPTLSTEQIHALLSSIDRTTVIGARNYAMVLLLLDTGLRVSELCALTLDTVILRQPPGYVKVLHGKGDKYREVGLTSMDTYRALIAYRDRYRPRDATNPAFFLGYRRSQLVPTTVQHLFTRLGEEAGIGRLYPHLLRHTSATRYIDQGGEALILQRRLGQTTLSTTDRYVNQSRFEKDREVSISPLTGIRMTSVPRKASRKRKT